MAIPIFFGLVMLICVAFINLLLDVVFKIREPFFGLVTFCGLVLLGYGIWALVDWHKKRNIKSR